MKLNQRTLVWLAVIAFAFVALKGAIGGTGGNWLAGIPTPNIGGRGGL